MKKKYEALSLSFLFVNLIYTYGVLHLQPSMGDEIVGELYRLFHLFGNHNVVSTFGLSAFCFLIGMSGSFVMALCGFHARHPLSMIQGFLSLVQGLLGCRVMTLFLHNRHLVSQGLVGPLGTFSTITILFVLCQTIFSLIVEMAVRNHIQIMDHSLKMPLIENISLSSLFAFITLISYGLMSLVSLTNIYVLFYLNIILLTGVLGCFSTGMSECLRKISHQHTVHGILLILICLISFMRLSLISCLLCLIVLLLAIKKVPQDFNE